MANYKTYFVSCKLEDDLELELFPDSTTIKNLIEENFPNVQVTAYLYSTMLPTETKEEDMYTNPDGWLYEEANKEQS